MNDKDGMSQARKTIMQPGMLRKIDRTLSEAQLYPKLLSIIANHQNHFVGEPVNRADVESEFD